MACRHCLRCLQSWMVDDGSLMVFIHAVAIFAVGGSRFHSCLRLIHFDPTKAVGRSSIFHQLRHTFQPSTSTTVSLPTPNEPIHRSLHRSLPTFLPPRLTSATGHDRHFCVCYVLLSPCLLSVAWIQQPGTGTGRLHYISRR